MILLKVFRFILCVPFLNSAGWEVWVAVSSFWQLGEPFFCGLDVLFRKVESVAASCCADANRRVGNFEVGISKVEKIFAEQNGEFGAGGQRVQVALLFLFGVVRKCVGAVRKLSVLAATTLRAVAIITSFFHLTVHLGDLSLEPRVDPIVCKRRDKLSNLHCKRNAASLGDGLESNDNVAHSCYFAYQGLAAGQRHCAEIGVGCKSGVNFENVRKHSHHF
jgi:hypothetical protein